MAEYRDATSALRARVASLEAELVEVERELGARREIRDRLSFEARSLETALEKAGDGAPQARLLERALLSALIAPAAGGIGMILTLVVAGLLGSIVLGERALPVASVFAIFGGLYAGYRAARQFWEEGAKR